MFAFVLVIFQVLFIIMLGAFFRASSYDSTGAEVVTFGLVTILGFVLMSSSYRKLSLFSLISIIFISFIVIEINILFFVFWISCFTSFTKETQMVNNIFINSVYAALAAIITCLDFIGLFQYWQVFAIIASIMTLGYSLCTAIIVAGLKSFDGGRSTNVFLYSGICSLIIWFVSIRGKVSILEQKKSQSYINYTLAFLGVAITLFSWPVFNTGGCMLSYSVSSLTSSVSLQNSAYINTLAALGVSLIMSSIFSTRQAQSQRLKPKLYIQCFINAGIIVSAYDDVSLYPVVGMVMAFFSTIITLLVDKYLVASTNVRNQSDFKMVLLKFSKILFRILWSFVGACIGAIVVKTRNGASLALLSTSGDYAAKAGYVIALWIIVLLIGLVFGVVASISINFYLKYRLSSNSQEKVTKITDELFFDDLQAETFPIYRDILEIQPQQSYEQDLTRRILNQSLLMQQKIPLNIYESTKKNQNHDTNESRRVQKETLVILNDFSKSKKDVKDINLSTMKKQKVEEPIATENIHIKRQQDSKRQRINPDYSPIDQLKGRESNFESFRPTQSIAEQPKELKTIPSSSRLVQILTIEDESPMKKEQAKQINVTKKLQYDSNISGDQSHINRANS